MSLERKPSNFSDEFLQRYKEEVQKGIARNLRNIYLANVKGFCTKGNVKNACEFELPPDETFMRMVETRLEPQIDEQKVEGWRKIIWGAWRAGNTGMLDARLGPVFLQLAKDYQTVNKALIVYPNDLDLSFPLPEQNANDI